MIDERVLLMLIPVIVLWCTSIPEHRIRPAASRRVHVGRLIAALAGSKSNQVEARAFGRQLGYLSMIAWYLVLSTSSANYLSDNAFVFGVWLGIATGLALGKIFHIFVR